MPRYDDYDPYYEDYYGHDVDNSDGDYLYEEDEYGDDEDYEYEDEPWDGFRDDVDADADVLRTAGFGTDEEYGLYDDHDDYYGDE